MFSSDVYQCFSIHCQPIAIGNFTLYRGTSRPIQQSTWCELTSKKTYLLYRPRRRRADESGDTSNGDERYRFRDE